MKNFRHYLEESKVTREYHLRIKTVNPLTDERMDAIEKLLGKYNLVDLRGPHKTILQTKPLDFYDIDAAEVWFIDVTTAKPVSAYVLQQELVAVTGIPEKFLIVRGDNDPREIEVERHDALEAIAAEAKDKGLETTPLLTTDPDYPAAERGQDGSKFYGNEHTQGFLKYLAAQAATRRDTEVKPASPLFDFVDQGKPESGEDFNAAIPDAPKSQPWWMADTGSDFDLGTAPEGNFDEDGRTHTRGYRDRKSGKQTDIQAASKSVRQPEPKKGKKK